MLVATLFHLTHKIPKKWIDLVEIRVDQCRESDLEIIKFIEKQDKPLLLTFRKGDTSDKEYFACLFKLAMWNSAYLDVEYGTPAEVVKEIRALRPELKIVLSHHMQEAHESLDTIYFGMQQVGADFYKIVSPAINGIEGLRLLAFIKKVHDEKLAAFCSGEKGQFTRIASKILGGALHFCSLSEAPPYGQFSFKDLIQIYRFHKINTATELYGLIGDPIDKSISHFTHNEVFRLMKRNARYVKVPLSKEELREGVSLLKEIGFRGLSVTMPLKKSFSKKALFSDFISQKFEVVNTLLIHGIIRGYNTDAIALGKILDKYQVKNKKVLLIGAGAIAKILAFLLHSRRCELIYMNRDVKKIIPFIRIYKGALFTGNEEYDVIINATPVGMDGVSIPIKSSLIQEEKIVFDLISYPKWTPLMLEAKKKNGQLIFGEEMFVLQAAAQFSLWK